MTRETQTANDMHFVRKARTDPRLGADMRATAAYVMAEQRLAATDLFWSDHAQDFVRVPVLLSSDQSVPIPESEWPRGPYGSTGAIVVGGVYEMDLDGKFPVAEVYTLSDGQSIRLGYDDD